MIRSWLARAFAGLLISTVGAHAATGSTIVPDRGALEALLGPHAVREDFERFPIDPFGAMLLDVSSLDATTLANGYGPGLVVPGVTIEGPGGLQWNGHRYAGQPSRTISGGTTLEVDFGDTVAAFGLDLLVFAHFPEVAILSVFGRDDTTLIGTFAVPVFDPSFEVFFGLADPDGIGRIALAGTLRPWSPVIDDLTFGAHTVPEPAMTTLVLLGAAVAWRRRRRLPRA